MTNGTLEHGKVGFDPLAYELIAIIDERPPEYANAADVELFIGERFYNADAGWASSHLNDEARILIDQTEDRSKCDHCGKSLSAIRFMAFAVHKETKQVVVFGHTCARELEFANEFELALHREREAKKAAERRAIINAKRDEWNAANPEQAAALDAYEADIKDGGEHDEFLDSLVKGRRDYGALTEKQTPWPTKALAKRAEWAAKKAEQNKKLATAPKLEEGRYEIEGTVISTKAVENNFSRSSWDDTILKMLVELDDGNRVWGTVPNALFTDNEGNGYGYDMILKGKRVAFTAAVERSKDDNHFGFFKRPTKARRVES